MQTRDIRRARFALSGSDAAPTGLAWLAAAPLAKRAYWRHLAGEMVAEKRRELHKGIGVDGQRLRPRKRPRPDGARGPVLAPHYADSRFTIKLRSRGLDDRAQVWWVRDWAPVVEGHATGEATGVVRDVCGLTAEGQRRAIRRARAWWDGQHPDSFATMFNVQPPPGYVQATPTRRTTDLAPPPGPAPPIRPGMRGWEAYQAFNAIFAAAAWGRTTPAQIEAVTRRLAVLPVDVVRDVAARAGVIPAPADKTQALALLRRALLDRLAEARRLHPPPPPPIRTPPPAAAVPETPRWWWPFRRRT